MIIGIGTDIVQIDRIERIIGKFGNRFLQRILHPIERQRLDNIEPRLRPCYVAKRFAGKEALAKALGSGINYGLAFKDISITNSATGKPIAKIHRKLSNYLSNCNIDISLSDDYPIAIAFVILSK